MVEIITIKNSHSLKQGRLFRVKQEICEIRKTILNCTFRQKLVYYNKLQLYSIYATGEINLTIPLTYMQYITNEYTCLIPLKNRNSTNNPTDLCLRTGTFVSFTSILYNPFLAITIYFFVL